MRLCGIGLVLALLSLAADCRAQQPIEPVNFLIITADDMNWDSVGCYGCPLKDITPNIDNLASRGIRFEHAHVASTACYPSRSAISTGRRGHRSGGEGFFFLRFPNVPTVQQILHDNGYRVGILGKVKHSTPYENTPWDLAKEMGRDTDEFETETAAFIDQSLAKKKPFYLIVNSHDPHRPYYKIDKTRTGAGDEPSRVYQPDEIPIHPTVPDHPDVRYEQACYFSSVRRFDDVVARVVKVLEERKLTKNTMVVLLSDHGMAVPSAKSNCYAQSTRTPFIVRWDTQIKPGQTDTDHMISTMDILPTILEAANIKNPGGMDGRTIMPLFEGRKQDKRDHIFTQYYMKIGQTNYQMRAVQNKDSIFVFNPWHNGKPVYSSSSMGGSCFATMVQLGMKDPVWAKRADYLLKRVPEEYFDLRKDPHCLNNVIDARDHQEQIATFKTMLAAHMKRSNDPMAEVFDVYTKTRSVPDMVKSYESMWDIHNIPGRVASNPVNRTRWENPEKAREEKRAKKRKGNESRIQTPAKTPEDEARAEKRRKQRAERRKAESQSQEK